jgi:casein kinase II subunit alpha
MDLFPYLFMDLFQYLLRSKQHHVTSHANMTLWAFTTRTWALYYHCIAWLAVHQLVAVTVVSSIGGVGAERAHPNTGTTTTVPQQDASSLPSYANYETMEFPPPWVSVRRHDDYLLTRRLGTGKFSDVFEAVDVLKEQRLRSETHTTTNTANDDTTIDPRTLCVVKCLKPVSERKIRREMLVLHRASALRNLARLQAIVLDKNDGSTGLPSNDTSSTLRMPSLVLEHAGPHAEWLCHPTSTMSSCGSTTNGESNSHGYLDDYEIRYYLFHLLIAIDGLHSIGIMHRDIKPRNVLINRRGTSLDFATASGGGGGGGGGTTGTTGHSPLMLIDLGLADFYVPGTVYNVRVASRHYKSPELLVGFERYDCAIDMWGFGCIMAGLLLRREPFFRGKDNVDQLGKILSVLGTDDLLLFLLKYKVQVTPHVEKEIIKYHALQKQQRNERNSQSVVMEHSKELALLDCRAADCPIPCRQAMDLLLRLLVYDHCDRWTAQQAMTHPYFDPVRHRVQVRLAQSSLAAAAAASSSRRRPKPPLD